ncbi:MAG TPA: hypothetical protein VHB45_12895 [Alloacidobacterium sp.]|nr:hypothetical protein [Alloacidobacterium sp.]
MTFKNLKNYPHVQLSLAIAAGVFGGLLALRIVSSIYSALSDNSLLLPVALTAGIICFIAAAIYGIRLIWRKHPRYRRAVITAIVTPAVLVWALAVIQIIQTNRREAAIEAAREQQILQTVKKQDQEKPVKLDFSKAVPIAPAK